MDNVTPNGYEVDTREHRAQFYKSSEWQRLREEAMKRDHYECVWCAEKGKVTTKVKLEVDHIKELEYYPQYALDIDNLRTLCTDCHNKRHHRFKHQEKRSKYVKYSSVDWSERW